MKKYEAAWEYGSSKPLAMQKHKKSGATGKITFFFRFSGGYQLNSHMGPFFYPGAQSGGKPPGTSHPGDAGGRLSENHKNQKSEKCFFKEGKNIFNLYFSTN